LKRDLTVALPGALVASGITTFLWMHWFGRSFGRIMSDASFYDAPGLRTSIAVTWPPYTIYLGAFVSVGLAFFILRHRFPNRLVAYGICFFIVTFMTAQFITGALQYFFVSYIKDHEIFHHDRPYVELGSRMISTLRNLPAMTLISMTFGVWFTKAMCPAIALSAAVVASLLKEDHKQ
jgi:hypothetical protein